MEGLKSIESEAGDHCREEKTENTVEEKFSLNIERVHERENGESGQEESKDESLVSAVENDSFVAAILNGLGIALHRIVTSAVHVRHHVLVPVDTLDVL